jgi:hypothetical protein
MNTKLMISALRQGKTGEQILCILDAITSDAGDTQPVDGFVNMPILAQYVPTLEEIAF